MLQYSIKQIETNIHQYIFKCFVSKIEIQTISFIFNTNPRFPPFLLHVSCRSGVTFIRRRFRDEIFSNSIYPKEHVFMYHGKALDVDTDWNDIRSERYFFQS